MDLLSPECAVHSFGEGARGFLRSEGVASVMLKRLSQAEADGDHIYALIKNTAVSHNGRGAGSLTSPDPIAQSDLIRECCERVGLDPRRLDYIEAQGMGNPLADIAEWRAFNLALRTLAETRAVALKPGKCLVSCLKPTLGHMEPTSALGALFKVVHALQTQTIYGIHRFTKANPELDLEAQPCRLAAQNASWPKRNEPRVAGLNSYGMGGNNAHILIEEYARQQEPAVRAYAPALIVLSAPNEDKLSQIARGLLDWLRQHPDEAIEDLAFTLQIGRDPMDYRLALVASSVEELAHGLDYHLNHTGSPPAFLHTGRVEKLAPAPLRSEDLNSVGHFWVAGGIVHWKDLYQGRSPRRVSLPGYPFEKRVCWLDRTSDTQSAEFSGTSLPQRVKAHLTSMLSQELNIPAAELDPNKHFLEYGIGSLTGLRLGQKMGRAFGIAVGLRDWMQQPTVEALAQFVASKSANRATQPGTAHTSQSAPEAGAWTLSECQRGLWALQKMRPHTVSYNVPICIRFLRRIQPGPFREACEALLDQHPILRCSIEEQEARLSYVPSPLPFLFEELELESPAPNELEEKLQERLKAPFSLEAGPMIRFHLVHCSPNESIVLVVAHHLVMDGLSVAPVMRTLLDAYLSLTNGTRMQRPTTKVDIGKFVEWERDQLSGESGAGLKTYWKQQLSGALPVLRLVSDHPIDGTLGLRGDIVSTKLPGELLDALQALGRQCHVSLPTLLLGVLKLLLHRYSGEEDIAVGVVTQVRPDDRFADLVGYFINLVPIRTRSMAAAGFADLAQRLQITLAEGIDHAAYPFPRMLKDLGQTPETGSNPIVQVGFEYQPFLPATDLERRYQHSIPLTQMESPRQAGELELVLEVVELAGGVDLHFKYDPAAYSRDAVRRMAQHFLNLAREAAFEPNKPIAEYRPLSQKEAKHLLTEWNDTHRDYPSMACLHELIQLRAKQNPEAVAVASEGRSLTYRELERRSDALAAYLQQLGARPDLPIAICLDRSPDLVVALMGVLKAGAAYLPLDKTYPAERLAFMLRDSGASILLTESHFKSGLKPGKAGAANGSSGTVIEFDRQWTEIEAVGSPRPLVQSASPEHLAYLIYTSGTTGEPKGVMVTHRSLVNFLTSMQKEPGLSASDRLLAVTSLSFDIAGLELFLPLLCGAQCWICPTSTANNAERLRELIQKIRPTVMQATPSTWRMLLHAGWGNEERVRILCGGEALPQELATAFIEGGMEAWNLYGPTETTIWSTLQRIDASAPTSIGRPIANTRIYIVDRQGQPVPVGVTGELWIAGDGLARGYWRRPELTQARFVQVPFLADERAYKTGDVACWREDGTIKYLGRTDHQVKIRGHRIEVEEIEACLNRNPATRDSAVVVREASALKQLVAYYVPSTRGDQQPADHAHLDAYLRRFLPAFMIPAFYVPVDAIPLTPNGKKDRKALMNRVVDMHPRTQETGSQNTLLGDVLAIWRELLKTENVRATDAFFEVGGDSVSAVLLSQRISQHFDVVFSTTDLFRHPTPKGIASQITAAKEKTLQHTAGAQSDLVTKAETAQKASPCPDYYKDSLAIIGISCQFPGAETHNAFWSNLKAGIHSAVFFSREELLRAGVPEELASDSAFVPVQLTIPDKDCFDPDFFRIPHKNAALMDPQSRLLLMHSWKALEDSGYLPADVADAGVFMSMGNNFYSALKCNAETDFNEGENYVAWLLAQQGTAATTISYQLGLRGPSYAVHANCSSSMVALHAALQAVRLGETRCALVGAASLVPGARIGYRFQEGMNLASDGRCKAFDAAADGMVGAEGVGVLLVKRADLAVRDGDHIYAVVRGVGVNNDGNDKAGFYAPGVSAQAEVIERVLRSTEVHPDDVSYVEAHGTGTKLGDPIEVAALSQAYGKLTDRKQYCGIGSVKSNIGHLDTAAGLAGCIKVALSLKHQHLPPTLHYRTPNPAIDFAHSPFYVVDRLQDWGAGDRPRRAGLSSLGIGGTNTHAILEESPQRAELGPDQFCGPYLVVLSARDKDRLREAASNLLRYVESPPEPVQLAALAFTLQAGRTPMEARLALEVDTLDQLTARLRAYLSDQRPVERLWESIVSSASGQEGEDTVLRWVAERNLPQIAIAWVQGVGFDWEQLYGEYHPRRISLPTYPFAREQCSLSAISPLPPTPSASTPNHPLLHENISTLDEQRYRATFTGREFFLADHVIKGHRILPGVAYLEMAREAVSQATGGSQPLVLKDVAWPRPFELRDQPRPIQASVRRTGDRELRFEISTADGQESTSSLQLCQGIAVLPQSARVTPEIGAALRTENYPARYSARDCYRAFKQLGIDYGPSHQAVTELFVGSGSVLARLVLPSPVAGTLNQFVLHPSLLDAALHASIGFYLREPGGHNQTLLLPFALEELEIRGACSPEMWVRITRRHQTEPDSESETLDIDLCDLQGRVQVRLKGLFSRKAGETAELGAAPEAEVWLERPRWMESSNSVNEQRQQFEQRYAILCDFPGLKPSPATYSWIEIQSTQQCPAKAFGEIATGVFGKFKEILCTSPKRGVLVQVVIPHAQNAKCLQGLSGLIRTVRLENPSVHAQLIEADPHLSAEALRNLLEDARIKGAVHIRYRNQKPEVQRLGELPARKLEIQSPWRDDGIYLITGGAGGLGLIFATEIARRTGRARVILVGRSEMNPVMEARLAALGARYHYYCADVSRTEDVEKLVSRIRMEVGEPHGVIHAAGIIKDDFILRKSPESFQQVLAPKVSGVVKLDHALGAATLDFFVLFSSLSGALGSVGQADYATGNSFLDEFADYRQALVSAGSRHGRTLSIRWPLWREGGMRVSVDIEKEMTSQTGLVPLPTSAGINAFYAALADTASRVTVLSGDHRRVHGYLAALEAETATPIAEHTPGAAPQAATTPPVQTELTTLETFTLEWLRNEIASILERPPHRLKEQEKFERYGIDSILAVQITNHFEKTVGSLPKTLFFEYQNLKELTGYFVDAHRDKILGIAGIHDASSSAEPAMPQFQTTPPTEVGPAIVETPPIGRSGSGDIAIIGMSGRFPQATDLAEFWKNLESGRDSIGEVPTNRWDWRQYYTGDPRNPGSHCSKWGGFLDGVDLFDPLFFNISPKEADLVDPQERLLLEEVWNLLESTGHTRRRLRERYKGRVAVYVGAMYQQYHSVESDALSRAVVSLSGFSGIANRVSYFFDFQGPSVAVDTMCSSSLVAIQMACDSIRNGQAGMAIAGAVNLTIHPDKFAGLTAAKLMGSLSTSRSFADGDGYLPAEGVGAVLLKPLERAIQDGDPILAVIKAVVTNHSGQSGGFGVPNPQAQASAVEECLRRSGVDPRGISYIESSANGSPLGDAIEVKALSNALSKYFPERSGIPIGSVKTNIGHAEAASGMAQLFKVALQMQHARLVPTLRPAKLNPNIVFSDTPFYLREEHGDWQRPLLKSGDNMAETPRRALISSVGAGGSTGHMIVEEYADARTKTEPRDTDRGPWLILLSARNRGRLEAQARRLQRFLKQSSSLHLSDVAYTLQVGREAMEERAALVIATRDSLISALDELAERLRTGSESPLGVPAFFGNSEDGNPLVRDLFSGSAGEQFVRELLARKEVTKLASYWVQGGDIDWRTLYEGKRVQIVDLPTYPFERKRCWLRGAQKNDEPPLLPEAERSTLPKVDGLSAFLSTEIAELLGLEPAELKPTKALNSLGFTSIDAVSLKSQLEQKYKVEIPIAMLNAYHSTEQLAASLSSIINSAPPKAVRKPVEEEPRLVETRPVLVPSLAERYQPFPLTEIQESFYLGRKMGEQARTGCHIYFEIEQQDLDIYRLNSAWNHLVQRHEMLRAVMHGNGTQGILQETAPYRFRTVDLRRRGTREQSEALARIREETSHRVYDPERWPLFDIRISLLPDRRVIHFSIDELIVDALSIELLFQEWQRLYDNPELELPELELSFRDYVLAAKRFADSPRAHRDLEYWQAKLQQMPSGPLLPGFNSGETENRKLTHRCTRLEQLLSAPHWSSLKRRAESLNVSPTALVLTLFVDALGSQSQNQDFSLILTFFNRMPIHPQVDQIVGPCISTSIFIANRSEQSTLKERALRTQRQLWEDLDHNSVSGIRALRELKRRHGISSTTTLPVVFTSMAGTKPVAQDTFLKDLSFSVTQTPQVYFDHQLYEQSGGLYFSWDVVKECFAPGAIDDLFQSYCQLLERAARDDALWSKQRREQVTAITAKQPRLESRPEDLGQPFPLTDQQQAYAFGRSEHGSQTPSNVYMDFECEQMDVVRLEAAWNRVVQTHPMLATTVQADGTQKWLATVPAYNIRVEDFSNRQDGALSEALASVEREMSARLCPLGGWPFFELRVSRLPAGKSRVHLCIDMIIADPASIDFVAQELFDAFVHHGMPLTKPKVTFQDYVRFLRGSQQNGNEAKALEYWRRKLNDVPPGPTLPRLNGIVQGNTYRLSRKLEGWDRLLAKAQELKIQPSTILLAAYVEVLWQRSDGQPFTIAIPCWQRPRVHPEIDRIVGDFTTMVWLPVYRLEGTFRERVIQYDAEVQNDLENRAVSGLRVLRKSAMKESGRRRHINFPVVFTDLSPQPAFNLPSGIQFRDSSSQTSQVELDNISAEYGTYIGLYWDVAKGCFAKGLIEGMFDDYCAILAGLVDADGCWDEKPSLRHHSKQMRLSQESASDNMPNPTL
jgi:amino acid adenylation domain-containing protein